MSGNRSSAARSHRGTIYYSPASSIDKPQLPIPPFQPRERRPHSIHITRFPSGFAFYEPPHPPPTPSLPPRRIDIDIKRYTSRRGAKRLLSSLLSPFTLKARDDTPVLINARSITPEFPSSPHPHARRARTLDSYNFATTTVRPANRESMAMSDSLSGSISLIGRSSLLQAHQPKSGSSLIVSTYSQNPVQKKGDPGKPICHGGGVDAFVHLTEPYVILTGFEHDGRPRQTENAVAMVRGVLKVEVTKSVKIRKILLRFGGLCQTQWPEGIPPNKTEFFQKESQTQRFSPYFDAKFPNCQTGHGDQCTYTPRCQPASSSKTNLSIEGSNAASLSQLSLGNPGNRASALMVPGKEQKRLSLNSVQTRSFQKGETVNGASPSQKGFTFFHPGTYEYPIEISLDHTSPETMTLPLGSVKWEIEVTIERAGAFKQNLVGTREVTVIRAPEQNSLEQTEPISINKSWDGQLHYEVIVSGKTFAIGSTIPMAFKLTPLAKIRVHRIRVYTTEHVDYFTLDKRVARKDIKRKLLLFEKTAGKRVDPKFTGSRLRFTSGGESTMSARSDDQEPNLVGDLSLGEQYWGSTEMELDVKIPTCSEMEMDRSKKINPDSTYKSIVVRHWMQITIRVSKTDPDDPAGKRRRQFEISIDSPYHIIHCKASSVYTNLPEYSANTRVSSAELHACGCPDSEVVGNADESLLQQNTAQLPNDAFQMSLPSLPPQAHFSSSAANGVQRPIHLLRVPSFGPPPFDADMAPPLVTPPPDYDCIVGTPSHDGLADYFSRLSAEQLQDEEDENDDDEGRTVSRTGAVNVATPGGRVVSRSMDVQRPPFLLRPQTFKMQAGDSLI